jgi:hypothetical protein
VSELKSRLSVSRSLLCVSGVVIVSVSVSVVVVVVDAVVDGDADADVGNALAGTAAEGTVNQTTDTNVGNQSNQNFATRQLNIVW